LTPADESLSIGLVRDLLLGGSLQFDHLAFTFRPEVDQPGPGPGMEGQSAIPRLVGFNLLDRLEKYFSQIDGTDREHNHQRYSEHCRNDNFYVVHPADHRGHSL
jgi:hypothetical protein